LRGDHVPTRNASTRSPANTWHLNSALIPKRLFVSLLLWWTAPAHCWRSAAPECFSAQRLSPPLPRPPTEQTLADSRGGAGPWLDCSMSRRSCSYYCAAGDGPLCPTVVGSGRGPVRSAKKPSEAIAMMIATTAKKNITFPAVLRADSGFAPG
jgi:hypothetical protein